MGKFQGLIYGVKLCSYYADGFSDAEARLIFLECILYVVMTLKTLIQIIAMFVNLVV
jgi:hypothetical protein